MFDVLADHRKNLLIQMCRVELHVGLSISDFFVKYIYIYLLSFTFTKFTCIYFLFIFGDFF